MPVDDPFARLGLPRRFDLPPGDIERAYLALAAHAHPDLADDPDDAEVLSADLNRARATLIDPEKRAIALWELWRAKLGVAAPDKASSLPPTFLMEMMDVREGMESARLHNDAETLSHWSSWADGKRAEYQQNVRTLFDALELMGDMPAAETEQTLARVKVVLNQWRYVERMLEQMG